MADKRISQLVDRGTVANNDVVPIVVSGATTTNKATISSIQTFMQSNLDVGVTSVGITLGSSGTDVSVSGSPITSSGNITINLPTASATNRGLLSAADWVTFNSKQDAGSFVTLDTAQTITAQKTFTTSGGSDSVIITTTGAGFALDAIKAGNGEVIRVNKTSGTGNAMTVIGGNFEAPTIVKTGGTSSQFLKADGSIDSTAYTTNTGTVTSVSGTGTVSGLSLSGTVTTSGNLTLGGTLSLTSANVTDALGFTPYNATNPAGYTTNVGTVTSVAASAGTGISISGSPITSSGTLTITNTAPDQTVALTASTGISVTGTYPNFTITNTSPSSGGTVTSVGLSSATSGVTIGSTPITTSGTITLAIATASGSQNGLLSSTDWTTFNNKQNALTNPVTGTGVAGQVAYWNGTNSQTGSNNLFWDNANVKLGIGISTPEATGLTVAGGGILVSLDSGAARKVLELYATSTGAKVSSTYVGASSYGSLELLTSNVPRLTITAAGDSTFSGALNGTSATFSGRISTNHSSSGDYAAVFYNTSATGEGVTIRGGSTSSHNALIVQPYNGATTLFNILATGAATFSSSVTATSLDVISASGVGTSPAVGLARFITAGTTDAISIGQSNNTRTINLSSYYIFGNGNDNYCGTTSNHAYIFYTNSAERMQITSGGNVGIGTSSPATNLTIEGTNRAFPLVYTTGYGNLHIQTNETTATQNFGGSLTFGGLGRTSGPTEKFVFAAIAGRKETTTTGDPKGYLQFGTLYEDTNYINERMRITSAGYLKASNDAAYLGGNLHEFLNNTANSYTLIVSNKAASPASTYIQDWRFTASTPNNSSARFWNCEDATANRAYMRSDGGLTNYQANDTNLSDERTKKDIEPLESYWDKFKAIEIVKFKYKDQTHDDFNIGVIAQQVEAVAPEFVDIDGWNTKPKLDEEGNEIVSEEEPLKSIYTADLHHATIKVLQEAMAKIEELQIQIDSLKNQMQ